MSNPNKLFELEKESLKVNTWLGTWRRGNITWGDCLRHILQDQVNTIKDCIEKYQLGTWKAVETLAKESDTYYSINKDELERQARWIEYIELAHHIEKKLLEYEIAYQQSRPLELVITGENKLGRDNKDDKGTNRCDNQHKTTPRGK